MTKITAARARELLTKHPKITTEWLVSLLEKEEAAILNTVERDPLIPSQWDRELAALLVLDEHKNEPRAHGYRVGALDTSSEVQIIMRHRLTSITPTLGDMVMREAVKLTIADASYHLKKYRPHCLEALSAALSAAPASPIPTSVANEGEREVDAEILMDAAGSLSRAGRADEADEVRRIARALSPALDNTAVEGLS